MTLGRRIFFAAVTLFLITAVVEGAAQIYWRILEAEALDTRKATGEALLGNSAINYLKQSDGVYGYVLKPSLTKEYPNGAVYKYTNAAGFAQIDEVSIERQPNELRIVAIGESTTHGHNPGTGNYPVQLKRLIEEHGRGYDRITVINAGVSGWTSGQWALYAEHKLVEYDPDIVLIYGGWNDFQSYDPFAIPNSVSSFEATFGTGLHLEASRVRSLALATNYVQAFRRKASDGRHEVRSRSTSNGRIVRLFQRYALGNLFEDPEDLTSGNWQKGRVRVSHEPAVPGADIFRLTEDDTKENTHAIVQDVAFERDQRYAFGVYVRQLSGGPGESAGNRDISLAVGSHGGTINAVTEFDLTKFEVKQVFGGIKHANVDTTPDGWHLVWMSWTAPQSETASAVIALSDPEGHRIYTGNNASGLNVRSPQIFALPAAETLVLPGQPGRVYEPASVYRHFLHNMDRTVGAFRMANPDVRIAVSTLVGRWDGMSDEQFRNPRVKTSWMQNHQRSAREAAGFLDGFNDLLRDYTGRRDVLLIDAAKALANADKDEIFIGSMDPDGDFAHMFGDHYQTLSRVFYSALLQAGYIAGEKVPSNIRGKWRSESGAPGNR